MTRGGRGKGWCQDSVALLLDHVEAIKPLGENCWSKVEEAFNLSFPHTHRDSDALKRKYASLKNNTKPTGDPDCLPEVIQAKRICRAIDNCASVLPLCDEDDDDVDNDEAIADCESSEHDNQYLDSIINEKPNRTGASRNELVDLSNELTKTKEYFTNHRQHRSNVIHGEKAAVLGQIH
ncbi:hypothetical protein AC1031_017772 [Aphanomyces cochlioides]|nr:hypothetical protein AC1031_017772 [Aphanomyces cochlioides]